MKNFLNHAKKEIGNNTKSPFTFSIVILLFVLEPLLVVFYDQKEVYKPFEIFILSRTFNFYIIFILFLIFTFIFKSRKKNA